MVDDNYSDYNRYGQLLFDIQTNNGGMYTRTPAIRKTKQRFTHSVRLPADITGCGISIMNMYYLDGRYNKYGGFGPFDT